MKKTITLLMLASAVAGGAMTPDTTLYREPYRPQYHFTPAHRWIGDPCGTIKHNGSYLAYSWGAARSNDLLHWTEINNHAFKGVPEGIATFTGSVVVDSAGTAGYGEGALIAAFTSFDEQSKKQSQSIAFSRDDGETFTYYDQNPVIDIWSTEFRDPTVIRDPQSGRWIMLVARALEKKVAFYGSADLKHWEWLSDFGPMGDSERSWECPDMFQLPVEGTDTRKWVLVVSVNWAREQYFVGDFDGKTFIPDRPHAAPLYVDEGLDYYASRVFNDFDNPGGDEVYTIGWVNTWDYAQQAPMKWGKGIWSIPRRLSLVDTPDGLRLRQQPLEALSSLEMKPADFRRKLRPGVTPLPAVGRMDNVYRMDLTLKFNGRDVAGINLFEGDGRKVTISYDSASQYLVIDRTNCADTVLPRFDRIAFCRVPLHGDTLRLDILADRSTLEIFADNGLKVFTLLTYPSVTQTGASLFSLHGTTTATLSTRQIKPVR